MKRARIIALLLAALLLAGCAVAESADPVVIKVGDVTIPLSEAQAYFDDLYAQYNDYYMSYGMALSAEELGYIRDEVIDSMLVEAIMSNKVAELGLGEITEEQKAEYRVLSDANFEEGVAELEAYYSMTRDEILGLLETNGVTMDTQFDLYLENVPYERLYNKITEGVEVDQAKIDAEYAQYVENDKATYENDVSTYELYTNYYGSEIYYIPEGYRLVKHILLEIPAQISADMIDFETDMSAVQAELVAFEDELYALENEQEAAEGEEAVEPRTAEEIQVDIDAKKAEYDALEAEYNALREKILPEMQPQIDEIMAKLEAGETFDALIAEYGKDPGALSFPEGYKVHKDSVVWDTIFRDTAMALENVGDVSEPALTDFGVHIIQYAGDLPGGAAPMTDTIAETIRSTLLTAVKDEMFSAQLETWMAEFEIETHPELIVLPEVQAVPTEEEPADVDSGAAAEEEAEAADEAVEDSTAVELKPAG